MLDNKGSVVSADSGYDNFSSSDNNNTKNDFVVEELDDEIPF